MPSEYSYANAGLQQKLDQQLGPEYLSTRAGGGGKKYTYVEGWKMINLANETFGFDGWSSNVVSLTTDFIDLDNITKKYHICATAIVRVTLGPRWGNTWHEDSGLGMMDNAPNKAAAIDKCKKEAVTDALKRALRQFGNLMGNCLYDKNYLTQISKMKCPPVRDTLPRVVADAHALPDKV
ncbi:Rad52 22 double-strand break repair protein [Cylindrobasidium torrendii FP15055 ss-10]|uniref:Rad52 22 double-strand break repair protein n=1 Tax=Cylindrobasidium torrendii FP15055 ss-10 TaxID=1314674 RepID=A0A0D7BR57_9AGAR|nr:Rad52 22 double-strand break repair protein [Cylindrobasidium torrendii FP15055 ss-10]